MENTFLFHHMTTYLYLCIRNKKKICDNPDPSLYGSLPAPAHLPRRKYGDLVLYSYLRNQS